MMIHYILVWASFHPLYNHYILVIIHIYPHIFTSNQPRSMVVACDRVTRCDPVAQGKVKKKVKDASNVAVKSRSMKSRHLLLREVFNFYV